MHVYRVMMPRALSARERRWGQMRHSHLKVPIASNSLLPEDIPRQFRGARLVGLFEQDLPSFQLYATS